VPPELVDIVLERYRAAHVSGVLRAPLGLLSAV
jgi:hypothetical protein